MLPTRLHARSLVIFRKARELRASRYAAEVHATSVIDELPEVRPAFRVALRFWLKLGHISFGGPAGQIAIMQTELVEKRRWISQPRFLHALNFCMLLPGPEAQQLAIYIGWLLHRTRGGIAAGALFVLPSLFILWALSFVYAAYGQVPWIAAIFGGLQPVVMAIVAAAVIRIARKSLIDWLLRSIALAAFIGIFVGKIPFPIIILGAGLVGFVATWLSDAPRDRPLPASDRHEPHLVSESAWRRAIRITAVSLILWWTPILLAGASFGWNSTLFRQALFFSKAAVVTFGGAYAVLPYVAQQAVEQYGWLHAGQMMDGLGLAETTPGPLIMVLQFVGFMGGWNQPGALSPLLSATLSALLHLGDICPLLPVGFPRRALPRKAAPDRAIESSLAHRHRRGRRRDSEPRGLVRVARHPSAGRRDELVRDRTRTPHFCRTRTLEMEHHRRRAWRRSLRLAFLSGALVNRELCRRSD